MKLYHGSNVEIDAISLAKGRRGKDFGRGFYLSADFRQAVRMSEIVTKREGYGVPTVTVFDFNEESLSALKVKRFDGYTREWAQFILDNRNNSSDTPVHDYDVVIGPIANDAVGVQIRQLLNGYISFDVFLENIQYTRQTIQYFFGTQAAINLLSKDEFKG